LYSTSWRLAWAATTIHFFRAFKANKCMFFYNLVKNHEAKSRERPDSARRGGHFHRVTFLMSPRGWDSQGTVRQMRMASATESSLSSFTLPQPGPELGYE
jgi:hypothetical protein